ncbi:unnamed protein product [Acanthoscelides obtectus]|uniref:Uncharacterized protein n=1 Tax=Acanthoscelides obtectus TaxID=200917 RepID=A0A9P0Q7S0_ACAOB|nr:unnamed protein product [Acanthoscelides obtectus]CAK1683867.1 hypothetical protein AOBTE_LOCUS34491 [Acanthoscelides obtectus]
MKCAIFIFAVISCLVMCVESVPAPLPQPLGFWDLFGYGGGSSTSSRRQARRYNSEGGGQRYKEICRVHQSDAYTYPGSVGSVICPY